MLPDSLQAIAKVFLADGIAPGGIDIIDTGVHKLVHQLTGALSVDSLDGDAAKAQAGDLQASLTQYSVFHICSSVFGFLLL